MKTPVYSILHTSARPDQWRNVYDDWMQKCSSPAQVEYVLVIDERWGFSTDPEAYATPFDNIHVVLNNRRRCYVDGVNLAAEASTGQVLIVNADDQFPCLHWNVRLREAIDPIDEHVVAAADGISFDLAGQDFVVEVSTGTPAEHERGIMVMPILSRARYERLGKRVFYPAYESMFADNDFCEENRLLGGVIDARDLMFPHRHAAFDGKGGWKPLDKDRLDAAYMAQNAPASYQLGQQIYSRRRAAAFKERRSIVMCLSGDDFRGAMVDSLLALQAHFFVRDFAVAPPVREATSNVYVVRENVRKAVMNMTPAPELLLWMDHDNPLTPAQFDQLLADLDARPDVDLVAGWCWIHDHDKRRFTPSAGLWAPDHMQWEPFTANFAKESRPREFECGGFPVVLMRMSALDKAGDGAFLPIVDNRLPHGVMGEDFAFFKRAEAGGVKSLVDPQIRVPHLKFVTVEPVFPEEGAPAPVKVACMIRCKNEGRWIARTIESVKPLCGADIYVMEDGSTDNTVAEATRAGAVVLKSPFDGMGLDERRDKNWLLNEVKQRCTPDWILMPDGDEELEPSGCDKIAAALATNPPADCFALRFINLWNGIGHARLDGVYGSMMRQSLFRADIAGEFRSYYDGPGENTNHVVWHTSNAPALGGPRVKPLNVFLIHYGYLHKEDRLRKYRWILSIDPDNEPEDFYRHTVQGDLADVPADAKLKHAGPLDVRPLPAHLIPRWNGPVPGPREVEWQQSTEEVNI